jgi:hypothetical protein
VQDVTCPYDTQRIAHVNTPRIATACIALGMGTAKSERLRKAREKAGYGSAADAAAAFGWGESGYRHHENGTRTFGADAAKKYGRAFKVKPGWLLCLEGIDEKATDVASDDRLVVNGAVEAGVWRQSEEWNDERAFVIEERPNPIQGRSDSEWWSRGGLWTWFTSRELYSTAYQYLL